MAALFCLLFLGLICLSLGVTDVSKMLELHPTWSFRLESVQALLDRGNEPYLTRAELQARMDATFGRNTTHILNKVGDPEWPKELPEKFDGRKKWPRCAKLMTHPSDEGSCTSDGPAIVASVATDRLCIFRNAKFTPTLSPEILAGCAEPCNKPPSFLESIYYVLDYGLPTGGTYNSSKGCLPWTEAPCKHTKDKYFVDADDTSATDAPDDVAAVKCSKKSKEHKCPKKCSNPAYKKSFDEDFTRIDCSVQMCHFEDVIMSDIMRYGPVVATMDLYDDFLKHPKGVYERSPKAKSLGRQKHYKIIGWGTEKGVKYWLAVNTWSYWGRSKVFKIARPKDYINPSFCVHTVQF